MYLVVEMGRKGPSGLQGSYLPMLPSAVSWLSPQCLSWTAGSCCPSTPPSNPILSSNLPCPAHGDHLMLSSVQDITLDPAQIPFLPEPRPDCGELEEGSKSAKLTR